MGTLSVLQLSRRLATRHVTLQAAAQIRLELTLSHLQFEHLLHGDTHTSIEAVQQHLNRVHWYTQPMLEVGLQPSGNLLLARTEPLRDKVLALRVELAKFEGLTEQRWKNRSSTAPESPVNPTYDTAYRGLMAEAEDIQSDVDDVIRRERGVLNTLQTCLIVGALLVAGIAAVTLFCYLAHRRRMEMALRESEEKFRSLYEMSDDADYVA